MKILFFDIETAPTLAYIWSPRQKWVAASQTAHETFILSWAAKWAGQKRIHAARLTSTEAVEQDDTRIVEGLANLIREADIIIGHNVDRFDVKRVNSRLLLLGLEPMGPTQTIDTLKLAKASFSLLHYRLDWIAQQLGVGEKHPTTFELWKDCYAGKAAALKEMDEYCRQDVVLLEKVFNAMKPYVKKLRRMTEPRFDEQPICPNCGAEGEDNFRVKKYYRTNAGTYPQFQCHSCKRYHRGRKSIKRSRFIPV